MGIPSQGLVPGRRMHLWTLILWEVFSPAEPRLYLSLSLGSNSNYQGNRLKSCLGMT